MSKPSQVIIVGGGASGMLAAISARKMGTEVTLLERNPRVGKKLLVTGNGRCNFTNIYTDINNFHGGNPKFAYSALAKFGVPETIAFFERLGIAHKVEELGKVFPMSDQASSVLDVLLYELEETGVKIVCDAYVRRIKKTGRKFTVELENGKVFRGDRVILAAGGKAKPSTGSDGNGWELAQQLGHTVTDVFPALVQLKLEGGFFLQLKGVKFVGTAEVLRNQKTVAGDRGDILFTEYGISGPPILQISRKAGELLQSGEKVMLKVIIMDNMTKKDLERLLIERFANMPGKTVEFSLIGLVNKRLIPVLLRESGIKDLKRPVGSISVRDREKIAGILTDWRFPIRGVRSWPSAQVTAGGVDTAEIDQRTLESKLVKGIFFAGEIIDIDGQSGGFNLQWAWSSGYVAGQNAALSEG